MRKAIWFATAALLGSCVAGSVFAGTRSEGAASAMVVVGDTGYCPAGSTEVHETGPGVDTVHGAFDAEYKACLQPLSADSFGRPTSWWVANTTGTLTFWAPGGPPTVCGTMDVSVADHLQVVAPDTAVGLPADGWVQGRVLSGTGTLAGARGPLKLSYGSPQAYFGFVGRPITIWYSMVLN